MKKIWKRKKFLCAILTFVMALSVCSATPVLSASAQESIGNGLILSTDSITLMDGGSAAFTAILWEGLDATRLACYVADPRVVTLTPVAYSANAAAFQADFVGGGTTAVAIYYIDNPAIVAYMTITTIPLTVEVPDKLGTNHDNYCTLVSYEFVPYDFTYANFRDYKSILKLEYKCASYKDNSFTKWGCFGFFYDADGNVLSKVHLYCSTLAKGRTYHSEFNVPIDAVRFTIEGFE